MSYMWDEFNIKTFAAETIVYRNGVFCPELSTLPNGDVDTHYELPVHIIYIGEIAGNCRLDINISAENQPVFLDVRAKNKKPAFLNIFIKNTGKNSELRGHVLLENTGDLTYDCRAEHMAPNTTILVQNNILAGEKTVSKISGAAKIDTGCNECESDISFSALCDKSARVEFTPAQYISAVPKSAGHSAALYRPGAFQIEYLRQSGLTVAEANDAMRDAFRNNFTLF